jgi:hypothetical protein
MLQSTKQSSAADGCVKLARQMSPLALPSLVSLLFFYWNFARKHTGL